MKELEAAARGGPGKPGSSLKEGGVGGYRQIKQAVALISDLGGARCRRGFRPGASPRRQGLSEPSPKSSALLGPI